MDRNDVVDNILNKHLQEVEGYSDDEYQDGKGIPTIGNGINLRSPATTKAMDDLQIDPNSAEGFKPEDLENIKNNIIGQKKQLFHNIKNSSFPAKDLNEAQEAALLSLTYNSPQLLGPNLRQHLNNNDDLGVVKEIAIGSNKDNSPGVLLRRLKEAELYGGPLEFQNLIKSLSDEEKNQVFNTLGSIKNEEQRNSALEKYAQFSPSYKAPMEKPQFFKMNNILKGNK